MRKEYENIDFDTFSNVEMTTMSESEKEKAKEKFYMNMKKNKKSNSSKVLKYAVAACLCLSCGFLMTPQGHQVIASVKQMFVGIGEHTGEKQVDNYATHVNKTVEKDGRKAILNDALASNHQLRCSFSLQGKNSTLKEKEISIRNISVNGKNVKLSSMEQNIGSENISDGKQYFLAAIYNNIDMPKNPKIHVEIAAGDQICEYDFILKNEAFIKATKVEKLNETFTYDDKVVKLNKIIVTPIDQVITVDDTGAQVMKELGDKVSFGGITQGGKPVTFKSVDGESILYGQRVNDKNMNYEMSKDSTNYKFAENISVEVEVDE